MCTPGHRDIRLTTNFSPDDLSSLFGTMHEFGHGVYEWGVDEAFARTPLHSGVSLGLHESQSRTWENLVGRSRSFWRHFYPQLQETFASQLGSVDEEEFYRAVNKVQPSLIRIDADEVTYNLHIILRFELEQDLIEGRIAVADLPDAWNARMKDYLGVDVPDDAHGVLQDMHWAGGGFGYFPTYALGNLYSAQLYARAVHDIPEAEQKIGRGELLPLREWLREHVHRQGRLYPPGELIQRATGSPPGPEPFVAYLRAKFGTLYRLS